MADSGGVLTEELAELPSLLEPLPTLALVPEKLDAGLRSLDHCQQTICCVHCRILLMLPIQIGQDYRYGVTIFANESFL